MSIVHMARLDDVMSNIRHQLVRLNRGCKGRMLENLTEHGSQIAPATNATVFYIAEGGIVVSWGMVYNMRSQRYKSVAIKIGEWTSLSMQFNGWYTSRTHTVDVYTDQSHRGKGYGSAIVEAMKREYHGKILRGMIHLTSLYRRHGVLRDLTG